MRQRKVLSLLLAFTMLLTMSPSIAMPAVNVAADGTEPGIMAAADGAAPVVMASTGWQPKPTKTVSGSGAFPLTLNNGDVLQINGPVNYTAPTGKSPITLAANADVKIIINGDVTLHGADASGTTGATAAINVPDGTKLAIYSAHDEELSTSTAAPKDTLTVTGGNAAAGANGGDALRYEKEGTNIMGVWYHNYDWYTGAGGNGGGGAAAAIGGNGGNGGVGPGREKDKVYIEMNGWSGTHIYNHDDNAGDDGVVGKAGSMGNGAGTIAVMGRLNLNAKGGSAAKGGNGGKGCGGWSQVSGMDEMIGGCGGGGGGGGGLSAYAFGMGGCGGASGGSGGHLSSDHKGSIQGSGGGGGGGGWPNGGGGGGGGAECSTAADEADNTSEGGAGGAGGAAGSTGRIGSRGIATGSDAKAGGGGAGGGGTSSLSAIGGTGGQTGYPAGDGGRGGSSVLGGNWYQTDGMMIVSTAANINTYSWGHCDGRVTYGTITPRLIIDLMDCSLNLSPTSYTYNGSQCKPSVASVTYSASTDRDGRKINDSGSAITFTSDYTVTAMGENVHCKTGTVSVRGNQDSNRVNVRTDRAVIGSLTQPFAINKANLTAAITKEKTSSKVDQPIKLQLSSYTSPTAGSGQLKDLLRESNQKTEGPQVTWKVTQGTGTFSGSGLDTTFTPTSSGAVKVQAVLSDMNDFNDYTTATAVFDIEARQLLEATLSTDSPHPNVPIFVQLDVWENVTYQWYADGTAISGATEYLYFVKDSDIGKKLSVKIMPSVDSSYRNTTVEARDAVENHSYENGFCTKCDGREKPPLVNNVYQVSNGGQLFWIAEHYAELNAKSSISLTADINLEASSDEDITVLGNIKNRKFSGIAYDEKELEGNFSGNGHTISNLLMDIQANGRRSNAIGLIGRIKNGTVSDLNVEGNMHVSIGEGQHVDSIGGIVGNLNGAKISHVTSRVNITVDGAADKAVDQVGGIIGFSWGTSSTVEKCMNFGSVTVNTDAANGDEKPRVGGIAGNPQNIIIRNCANHGTVKATAQGAMVGGIAGRVYQTTATIKNSYNYGAVSNGGGNFCGAIVGRLEAHNAANLTDNYYLDSSADVAFGAGSNATSASAPAKTVAQFASGEVCYLVNGSSSVDDVIWRQNVDNGHTPYDTYPVYDGDIVSQNLPSHNCMTGEYVYVYSNSASDVMDHINHHYENGFCTCCDEREPANQTGGVYQITNGGQLYWFAEHINSGAISNSSAAVLTADIDLEGSENGQAAGYEGINKDRNFPGIGTHTKEYTGTFNGSGYTVSELYIERSDESPLKEDIGLFGRTNGATVSDMTVKGRISMTGTQDVIRIGGVIGLAYGTTVSKVSSYVDISNTTNVLKHVGGVVGSTDNGGSVKQCMYFGNIDLHYSHDCIGGIVGYTNSAEISYCANHGTVKSASNTNAPFLGGILGYINNTTGSVRNCYNYGTVQNGRENRCGAIVGWLRGHTANNFTDNYYLEGSVSAAFGVDSNATSASAPAKTAAQFARGEVCYLVNGKTSTGSNALWKQDIDNDNTPYDIYPLFDAAAVYFRSDGTYSNEPEQISVTISWGAMEFEYSAGRWNPDTHENTGGWSPLAADGNDLKVQNDSNVDLEVGFIFTSDADFTQYNLTGTFNGVAVQANRVEHGALLSTELNLKSLEPADFKNRGQKKLGDITVRLTTIGGGGD